MIKVNYQSTFITKNILESYQKKIKAIHTSINNKSCLGSAFLGWYDLPMNIATVLIKKINIVAAKINSQKINFMVVIGIGGSYLGTKAAYDILNSANNDNEYPKMLFAGHNLSSEYLHDLLTLLENKRFGICFISKSGTTMEPTIAFNILEEKLVKQVGIKKARELIIVITGQTQGKLAQKIKTQKYMNFIMPPDIGGRYSVLTAIGLVPLAICGIKIQDLIIGSQQAYKDLESPNVLDNQAYLYAVCRHHLYEQQNFSNEIMCIYEPQLHGITEWWKQLFAESEGKNQKGLLPLAMTFPTDLHSLGQMLQDGHKNLFFETVIMIDHPRCEIKLHDSIALANATLPASTNLSEINKLILTNVVKAHFNDGGINNLILECQQFDTKMIGYFFYFMMRACAVSALLLGVNPFDQPGVAAYKKNVEAALKKLSN